MNSQLNIHQFIFQLVIGMTLIFTAQATLADAVQSRSSVSAKMSRPPQAKVTLTEIITFYKAEQSAGKITKDQSEILQLATLAKDVFKVEDLYIEGSYPTAAEKVKSVRLFKISEAIHSALGQKNIWTQSISKNERKKISESADLIKKSSPDDVYVNAWFAFQLGDKKQAKALLNQGFEKGYAEAMKLKQIDSFGSPLQRVEAISKALTPLSNEDENKLRESKLQKMRLHVSQLPDLMMMT
jgi:hypothetical protein